LLAQAVNHLDEEERLTYLRAVLGEVDRMMGLITELLDVSRIETNRLEIARQEIQWIDFIARRVSAFRVQNPDRQILYDAEERDINVFVDADRMRQVIDNLFARWNARRGDGQSGRRHGRNRRGGPRNRHPPG
jgi:signal transduction histidine kinase